MGRMGSSKSGRRARRQLSDEFRAGAVWLVLDEGKTIGALARELDLTPSSLANWVRHAQADRTKGRTGLTTEERAELAGLRKENRELRMERDILKKAAAGSRRRCNAGRQSISRCVVTQRLARAHVEVTRDHVETGLSVDREVGALRKILPQKTVRVFVRPALPRTLRIAEVHADVCGHGEGLVCGQFHPAVPGERRHQAGREGAY